MNTLRLSPIVIVVFCVIASCAASERVTIHQAMQTWQEHGWRFAWLADESTDLPMSWWRHISLEATVFEASQREAVVEAGEAEIDIKAGQAQAIHTALQSSDSAIQMRVLGSTLIFSRGTVPAFNTMITVTSGKMTVAEAWKRSIAGHLQLPSFYPLGTGARMPSDWPHAISVPEGGMRVGELLVKIGEQCTRGPVVCEFYALKDGSTYFAFGMPKRLPKD